jgi:hypothetical protein
MVARARLVLPVLVGPAVLVGLVAPWVAAVVAQARRAPQALPERLVRVVLARTRAPTRAELDQRASPSGGGRAPANGVTR